MNRSTMMKSVFRSASAVMMGLAAVAALSCGRTPGPDSDGDGLFDFQEELFKTITGLVDSDGDKIPDGADMDPLSGDPELKLTVSPAYQNKDGSRCVMVGARVVDGRGKGLRGAEIQFSWGLGELTGTTTDDSGMCRLEACSVQQADTTLEAETQVDLGTADVLKTRIDLSLKELVVPGVNTAPWEGAGPIAGSLKAVVLSRDTLGLLRPFEGAAVHVNSSQVSLPFMTTGPEGVVEFVDAALAGPVDVTVGAPGHSYITHMAVNGAVLSVVLSPLDATRDVASSSFGTIEGTVRGFFGEGGLARFPDGELFDQIDPESDKGLPIAIVQTAITGRPLSSMSMGSVLEPPVPTGIFKIPSNMAFCEISDPEDTACEPIFRIENVPEGQHLIFALGGVARHIIDAISDPYQLEFEPRALAITRVYVEAGKVTTIDDELVMNIDLTPESGKTVDFYLGNLPDDWKTGKPMPNALVMPVIDTGGEGFIFVAVNGDYNRVGFANPIKVRFPDDDDPAIVELGLKTTRLGVGLAGRKSYLGGDPPGISTPVRPGVKPGDTLHLDRSDVWLEVPQLKKPIVTGSDIPLDTVSIELFDDTIEWFPVANPQSPDLYVVRLNYLTEAPKNEFVQDPGDLQKYGTLGGPRSHVLWEFLVPPNMTSITLPEFPEGFPTPYLGNPDPTPKDSTSPHRFGPKTIEVELSAYVLGADGKEFNYSDNFAYSDVNMHCTVVSQDSVPVNLK